jgi:hypothetical protein
MPFSLTLSENDWSLSVSKSCDNFILLDLAFTFLGRAQSYHDEGEGFWRLGGPSKSSSVNRGVLDLSNFFSKFV